MALLDQKVALVTGGTRGIGKGIVERFLEEGADVAFTYVSSPDKANALADELAGRTGRKVLAIQSDAGDFNSAQAAVDQVVAAWGRLDILVNNAGITKDGLLMRMSDADFDDVIRVNLKSAFVACRAASRPMMKGRFGRIVNVGSVSGLMGNAGQVNYAAAKAGLVGMTKSIARELGSKGITANVVAPGFIETDMTAVLPPQVKEQALPNIPLKRFGTPTDIAAAIGWLTSDEGGYVTGQVIVVDGGMAM
jgi:3-oxoacyl-[acyl-carrier protein] reductase